MRNSIEIENIEEMRHLQGIEDVQLEDEIDRLRVGDLVKLTFLTGTKAFETLAVKITSIQDGAFRGQLTVMPASSHLSQMRVGSRIKFTRAHIHSIVKGRAVFASCVDHAVLSVDQPTLRGTDSNSLLRMYDQAQGIFSRARFQQERAKADKAVQRIARELQRRKIKL